MTPITQSNTNEQYHIVDASLADFISVLFCNNSQRTDDVIYSMTKRFTMVQKHNQRYFCRSFYKTTVGLRNITV